MTRRLLAGLFFLALGLGAGAASWAGLALLGEDPALGHLRAGHGALVRGAWEEAARELRHALASPDGANRGAAHHNLGLALLRISLETDGSEALSRAREAVEQLEEALRWSPGIPSGAWNLELALRRAGELEGEGVGVAAREAERLLASLGLLEEGGRGDDLRARLEPERGAKLPPAERGPPW